VFVVQWCYTWLGLEFELVEEGVEVLMLGLRIRGLGLVKGVDGLAEARSGHVQQSYWIQIDIPNYLVLELTGY
jgi:hypothetical protein